MKFGKQIQAQQVPGWSQYYLDYKFLKKIISSLAANRPASEAAALALGVRPHDPLSLSSPQHLLQTTRQSPALSPIGQPPILSSAGEDLERGPDFRAHKAAFFFKLERELEKINGFYLQKEAEVILRMETLLSKRRAAAVRGVPDVSDDSSPNHVEWSAVEEGFRLLERDLAKLQQFVEINAIGFRKILKKYDKRSKSTTKELYLARQVDVQPVFNRQLISELADTVATCLLNITDLSSGLRFEGSTASDILTQQMLADVVSPPGPFRDLESNFYKAISAKDTNAVKDCVHYSEALLQQSGGKANVTRILWNVILEAPPELADLILGTLTAPFDYHFVDDINGRTCLHEAAISGAMRMVELCFQNRVQVDKRDVYGRTALHYAAMKGHSSICKQLLAEKADANLFDRDNYSPLVYATLRGDVATVRTILDTGRVPAQSKAGSGDFDPLSLAAKAGHLDVAVLLLEHGGTCRANSNGEYPMHLAAREGHASLCKLLLHLEGWDTTDKYHEWTPLFHAARHGHADCVKILVNGGCRTDVRDELGYNAAHYAAWYGHDQVYSLLLSSPVPISTNQSVARFNKSPASDMMMSIESEIDQIPSLSLPPPIMPHRVYGHNYLVHSYLVQVLVGRAVKKKSSGAGVRIHHRLISSTFQDETLLVPSPLKLVMTAGPHVNSVPYTVSLPQRDDEGTFSFQVPSLENLLLEFSLYPNFGTKTIGRAVALPSMISHGSANQVFTLAILDKRLHVIGEVDFQINIISPFSGVTLDIGGDLETYWKSTILSAPPIISSRSLRRPHHAGSAHASPSLSLSNGGGQPMTVSSLQGEYVHVVVQVTRDLCPVVAFDWHLPQVPFQVGIADMTLAQYESIARSVGRHQVKGMIRTATEWGKAVSTLMVSVDELLKTLPLDVNVVFDLAYPGPETQSQLSIGSIGLNTFVDAVLTTIFQASDRLERRKVTFCSFSPDVCAALNWKQPNYPVFFVSTCGRSGTESILTATARGTASDDQRATSVGAAVEFAKTNNLLGLFLDGGLLAQVPSLVDVIRGSELLVGVHGSSETFADGEIAVDACFRDHVVYFVDRSTQEWP